MPNDRATREEQYRLHMEMTARVSQAFAHITANEPYEGLLLLQDLERDAPKYPFFQPLEHGKGIAWLLMGDFSRAVQAFQNHREHVNSQPIKVVEPLVGVALWCMEQRHAACEDWASEVERQRSKEITHTDMGGGVIVPSILFWASLHEGLGAYKDGAWDELKRVSKRSPLRSSAWPGTIAPYLIGKRTDEELMEAAQSDVPLLRLRWLCQMHFHMASRARGNGDIGSYNDHMREAASQGYPLEAEFHLARFECAMSS